MNKLTIYAKFPDDSMAELQALCSELAIVACEDEHALLFHLEETEIFFTMFRLIDAQMLRRAPRLKWIQALTAGVDTLPLDEIRRRGIILSNGRGIHRIHMAETRGLIAEKYFRLMKPTACFIKMGRGPTVNQADLLAALQDQKIRGLCSDVFETEPLPSDSPLWNMENVILTPHIAGVSAQYIERAMEIIRHNVKVYASGAGE
ncbi:MAG: hypothetical protein JSW39_00335, partial [Desulfobacterales bacterium]